MKALGYTLAVLALLITAFVALAGANKSFKLAGELSDAMKITDSASAEEKKLMEEAMDKAGVPGAGRIKAGAVVGGLGGIAALVLLIAAFAKKNWVKALGAVTVGAAAISAAVYPHIPTGPADGAAPRTLALVALVAGVIGAGGALLATRPKVSL